MKILSLFDGMSCGQQAITNLGIKDYTYFSSEIDKFAIQVTQENFPNTIQIGDVKNVGGFYMTRKGTTPTLHKFDNIDLLLGGSPCQGFSFAGKQLNFEDSRSALFFEYVRILKEVKPKYFLLENVKMKKEYQDVISEHLFGIQPTEINSSLLTAQNRKRLYWIGELQEDGTYKRVEIEQPEDKGILLKDILEDKVNEEYYLSQNQVEKAILNRKGKTFKSGNKNGNMCLNRNDIGKSLALTSSHFGKESRQENIVKDNIGYRLLTPTECERLQGVKDNYTSCVSNSQRYKMLGNGWTIPVIEHILKHIFN